LLRAQAAAAAAARHCSLLLRQGCWQILVVRLLQPAVMCLKAGWLAMLLLRVGCCLWRLVIASAGWPLRLLGWAAS
jgi:hypothetical protein